MKATLILVLFFILLINVFSVSGLTPAEKNMEKTSLANLTAEERTVIVTETVDEISQKKGQTVARIPVESASVSTSGIYFVLFLFFLSVALYIGTWIKRRFWVGYHRR